MARLGLETEVLNEGALESSAGRLAERGVVLPKLAELADPSTIDERIAAALADVDPDTPHPLNLFRVHWFNQGDRRGRAALPEHVVLPEALTGVPCKIVVLLGNRFPMIRAHKVLAAYGCLVPRLVTGQFDATHHRAIWPSTGNYCRGGVAISRVLGCRGVAVLPEGMSEERFRWLGEWVEDECDIVRTFGTESNVKEIYDKCAELDADPDNIIFNQFCEFGNHLIHYLCTGNALEAVFTALAAEDPSLSLAAFVSATGSAGTLGAGDGLKERRGSLNVAVEALECPTMLYSGFGEHNIQGIGDKHIPLIHNMTNTDLVVAVSDRSTDSLNVLFNTDEGRRQLESERGVSAALIEALGNFGLSSICNVLAAVKTATHHKLGASDVVMTVATDGAEMYRTEIDKAVGKYFGGRFGAEEAGRVIAEHLDGIDANNMAELGENGRRRLFNLGYFTWVEQQNVSLADFEARRSQQFWRDLRALIPAWDRLIEATNQRTGVVVAP